MSPDPIGDLIAAMGQTPPEPPPPPDVITADARARIGPPPQSEPGLPGARSPRFEDRPQSTAFRPQDFPTTTIGPDRGH